MRAFIKIRKQKDASQQGWKSSGTNPGQNKKRPYVSEAHGEPESEN